MFELTDSIGQRLFETISITLVCGTSLDRQPRAASTTLTTTTWRHHHHTQTNACGRSTPRRYAHALECTLAYIQEAFKFRVDSSFVLSQCTHKLAEYAALESNR